MKGIKEIEKAIKSAYDMKITWLPLYYSIKLDTVSTVQSTDYYHVTDLNVKSITGFNYSVKDSIKQAVDRWLNL